MREFCVVADALTAATKLSASSSGQANKHHWADMCENSNFLQALAGRQHGWVA